MKEWSTDIENILIKVRLCSLLRCKYHKKNYFYLSYLLRYFRIPIIVLSSFTSVTNVAFQNIISYQVTSIICCFLSLIITLISTIEMFLQIRGKMESDLHSAKSFSTLALDITKMIGLSREHRPVDGLAYLDEKLNEYKSLAEESIITDLKLHDKILQINLIENLTKEEEQLLLRRESMNKILDTIKENENSLDELKNNSNPNTIRNIFTSNVQFDTV